ncbi:MAG: TlpA disulfide reductase family protein [Sphingomonas fennica]
MTMPLLRRRLPALALAALLAGGLAGCGEKAAELTPGRYRAVLALPLGELPVGLDIARAGDGTVTAALLNGDNRVPAEKTTLSGDTLTLAFPSYDSTLTAKVQPDGTLKGSATLRRATGPVEVPLAATPVGWRFYEAPKPAAGALAGTWLLTPADPEAKKGLLILRGTGGNDLAGTVQFPTGDVRYLAGQQNGDEFALSTFDGNQGSVWRGRIENGQIIGENFGATSKEPTRWTARPQGSGAADQVVAVAEEKPPVDRIAFTFPDVDGKPVSLADPRFKGKVVVVAIGGTWCPNCHDEAQYLGPYVKRRRAEGLEVIGLQFEYTDDQARSAAQSRRFAERYKLDYPLLVAGKATPEDTKRALPAIGGVKIYPTTLFVDRQGKLRAIHTGYAGPATGTLNEKAMADFDGLVSRLLAEKA